LEIKNNPNDDFQDSRHFGPKIGKNWQKSHSIGDHDIDYYLCHFINGAFTNV
jgi:hypothetical protein